MLYVPHSPSFFSILFFVQNLLLDLVHCQTSLLFFYIPLSYSILITRLSIIFCLSSGDIYLSIGISLSFSFVAFCELFWCKVFETFVILLYYYICSSIISIIYFLSSGYIYIYIYIYKEMPIDAYRKIYLQKKDKKLLINLLDDAPNQATKFKDKKIGLK